MKVTELDDFIAPIGTPELQKLARFFARNLVRASNLRYMHFHLIWPGVLSALQLKTMTQVMADRAVDRVFASRGQFAPEFMQEVRRRMEEGDEPIEKYMVRTGLEHVNKLAAQSLEFGEWVSALEQSAAMALWSAFESLVSDVWVCAVNCRPDLFAAKAMRQFNESLQRQGLSSRSIPIGVAARYNFDLRNHIGEIIANGIDFTSLSDVRKAYECAFGLDDEGQKLIEADELKKLVLIRNLIAHRSGIVDQEFRQKTDCSDAIGDELKVTDEMSSQFMDAVKKAGIYLLKTVDRCLMG